MKTVFFGSAGESGSPQTAEWLAWRLKGVTGTDALVIAAGNRDLSRKVFAGRSPPPWVKSVEALWQVKTGRKAEEIFVNPAMKRGTDNEPLARRRYEGKTGTQISPAFGEMDADDSNFVRASLDGVDFNQNLLVEIKVPGARVHEAAMRGTMPGYYLPQMAHQAMVLWGHPHQWEANKVAHFVSYCPEDDTLAIVDRAQEDGFLVPLVSKLKSFAADLLVAERTFWESVTNDTVPCSQEWLLAAQSFIMADSALEEAKKSQAEAKNNLVALLGEQDRLQAAGVTVYRSKRKGAVDYKSLLDTLNFPQEDCEKFRGNETESITVKRT